MCGLLPYRRCRSRLLSGVVGVRFGSFCRLRIACLRPRYHFSAAGESCASMLLYRSARSRSARGPMLTPYAMLGFEFLEELVYWPHPSLSRILQTLPDTFLSVGAGGDIEQALICLRVLNHRCSFAVHG